MLSVVKDNAAQLLKQFGLEDDMDRFSMCSYAVFPSKALQSAGSRRGGCGRNRAAGGAQTACSIGGRAGNPNVC